jgi:hypothetical protein
MRFEIFAIARSGNEAIGRSTVLVALDIFTTSLYRDIEWKWLIANDKVRWVISAAIPIRCR